MPMRREERYEEFANAVNDAMNGRQARIWTALPGIVQSFNATENTVSVQPAIKLHMRNPDGTFSDLTMPVAPDIPVHFPGAGGFVMTVPPQVGDECLLVFSSRCIDNWFGMGGVQSQRTLRMHDLSDGFAILGTRSMVNAVKNVSMSSVQLRTIDGTSYVEIGPVGGPTGSGGATGTGATGPSNVNIVSAGGWNVTVKGNGTIAVSGDCSIMVGGTATVSAATKIHLTTPLLEVTGQITAGGNVTAGQGTGDKVTLQQHIHPGVMSGGSDTGKPQAGQ